MYVGPVVFSFMVVIFQSNNEQRGQRRTKCPHWAALASRQAFMLAAFVGKLPSDAAQVYHAFGARLTGWGLPLLSMATYVKVPSVTWCNVLSVYRCTHASTKIFIDVRPTARSLA